MPPLETRALHLGYEDHQVIHNLDLRIPEGQITVLVGGNGCGKSTLLKAFARLLKPRQGTVLLDGHDIQHRATRQVAQRLAILPQGPTAPEGLTVHQLVRQGRYPHQRWLQSWTREDEDRVDQALADTDLEDLAHTPVDALSGGQRQRAWIAMTLAQDTGILLLDEPTTYLDLTHQIDILDLLAELNTRGQKTIVMVLHDLNLACRYAHHIVAVRDGRVHAKGRPDEVVTETMVREVFNLGCRIIRDPLFDTPLCIPFGKSMETRREGAPNAVDA
ncbi:MAG: ABC transporter ATP-binding protein [Marinobacter sp.]|uniref:ABC transporter ATP-binding protein n=1 Tax=Marinobacter sp. TaxID=50741 RepID=UPI0034A078FD